MKRENVLVSEDALARQREFEAKIKKMFTSREAHPVACVDTFGCQQNVADGQKLMGMLADSGFTFTEDPKEADLVILNTCAVREHAEQRVFGNLGILTHTKKENPEQVICLCGCMAQEERVSQRVKESYRHVDLVFGPHALWKFPELLWQVYETKKRVFSVQDEHGTIAEGIPVVREKGVKAWVSIMYGCNNFCTYCIVPYARGNNRSVKEEDIISQIRELLGRGFGEICLTGVDACSYRPSFSGLIQHILEQIPELPSLQIGSLDPAAVDDDFIALVGRYRNVHPHFHLSVQSGDNMILKRMRRRHTREDVIKLCGAIRRVRPEATFGADFICGFPTESDENFQNTLKLVTEAGITRLHVFPYSERPGTPAALMPQLPVEIRRERARILREQGETDND